MIYKLIAILLAMSCSAFASSIELNPENTVVFRGQVTDTTVLDAQLELARLDALRGSKNYPIYLVMDSPGGSIDDGEAFIQYALTVKNLQTITLFAASMGSAIVEALPGTRHIVSNGLLMFHRAKVGLNGQISEGEFESRLAMIKAVVDVLEQRNAKRLNLPIKDYKLAVKDELWISSADAVEKKAADKVSKITCTHALISSRRIVMFPTFFFDIPVEFSGCPLFRTGKVIQEKEQKFYQEFNASVENGTYWSRR